MPGYTVHRLKWTENLRDKNCYFRVPGMTTIASFPTYEEAITDCQNREENFRRNINPFQYGGPSLHYQSNFDMPQFQDWILDVGLELPNSNPMDWIAWWEDKHPEMTPYQRGKIWQALDKIRFFDVVKQPNKTAFLAQIKRRNGRENDPILDMEGGILFKVFPSRTHAEKFFQKIQSNRFNYNESIGTEKSSEILAEDWLREISRRWDMEISNFFDVVEIELEECLSQTPSQNQSTYFLAYERTWSDRRDMSHLDRPILRKPLKIFSSRRMAEEFIATTIEEHQRLYLPLHFGPNAMSFASTFDALKKWFTEKQKFTNIDYEKTDITLDAFLSFLSGLTELEMDQVWQSVSFQNHFDILEIALEE